MLAPPLFLAQSPTPISGGWQADLFSALLAVWLISNVWDRFKRKPPLEETFATKKETGADARVAKEADERLERELKSLDERASREINALDARTQQSIRAMNEVGEKRAQANRDLIQEKIGLLERVLSEKINENRENNTGAFAKIEGRLDSFQVSMQGMSNDVMHQIGRLEGQMDGVKKSA